MRILLSGIALMAAGAAAQSPPPPPLFEKPLADLPGKEIALVEVVLPPGGASPAHRHNAHVVVYVLEGSIVMQVAGKPEQTLGVGQTFSEDPGDVHTVGRNASTTRPARFLAFFVKDRAAPRTIPAP
ncbi:cupin domain-containing protein [Sandarakinorhabdus rubra]|uniref:cupin domain-containing protein n=1 Tax=Sandarakinorhabdus rubra TaxID=2672568 RepID=UPI0013DD2416|nr:cupin domain-containing protein [Sandarakinorhabdus rubra]